MKVLIPYQCDPETDSQGGGVRYVKNLIEQFPGRVSVLFWGVGRGKYINSHLEFKPITKKDRGYPLFVILAGLKCFFSKPVVDLVHVHRSYFALPFLFIWRRIPVVCTFHGRTFSVFESRYGKYLLLAISPLFYAIERAAIKRLSALTFVSEDVKVTFEDKYPALMNQKSSDISIIGSGINLKQFEFSSERKDLLAKQYGENKKYLLAVGRLEPVKNYQFLISEFKELVASHENLFLVFAGKGSLEAELKESAKELPVAFIGEVSPQEIPDIMSSADVLTMSSHHEGSPTVIKEALAVGTPVVTRNVGDVSEYVFQGQNGFISENKMGESIVQALKLKREKVHESSKFYLEENSIQALGNKYLNIYKQCLNQ